MLNKMTTAATYRSYSQNAHQIAFWFWINCTVWETGDNKSREA